MKHIALIGAKGYVGSALYKQLNKDASFRVEAVDRKNYSYWKKREFDIVINAAMPSARFWAKNNPDKDFLETVKKTADIVYGWKYKKIIQVSTISARTEQNTVYGRHKAVAEMLCNFDDNLIIRLTSTFDDTLQKGILIDMLNGKRVYVSRKSSYGFASLSFVCNWIAKNFNNSGIQEVGAKNVISLEKIAKHFKLPVVFEGRVDIQEVQNPSASFPDAKEVLLYLQNKIKR